MSWVRIIELVRQLGKFLEPAWKHVFALLTQLLMALKPAWELLLHTIQLIAVLGVLLLGHIALEAYGHAF